MARVVFDLYAKGEKQVAHAFHVVADAADHANRRTGALDGASMAMRKSWGGLKVASKLAAGGILAVGGAAAGAALSVAAMTDSVVGLSLQTAKARTVLGREFARVDASLAKTASNFGITRIEGLGLAGTFADMAKQTKFSTRESANMSLRFVDLAGRIKFLSAGAFDAAAASEALSAAFRGEYDSLQRVVPAISAARVETLAESIQKKSSTKITEDQAKMLAVLKIVQDGTRTSSALMRTEEGKKALALEQSRTKIREQWQDLQTKLLPAFSAVWAALATELNPALADFQGWVGSPEGKKAMQDWTNLLVASVSVIADVARQYDDVVLAGKQMVVEAKLAWLQVGLSVAKFKVEFYRAMEVIPGMGDRFRRAAQVAEEQVAKIQGEVDSLDTKASQLAVQRLQAKIDSLKGKTVDARTSPAAKAQALRDIRELQDRINRLEGRSVTISARAVYYGDGSVRRINSNGTLGPIMKARGGAIDGPGTETSDSIPARLSRGEHVISAREVRGAGGHRALESMRSEWRGAAGYASGGEVTGVGPVVRAVDNSVSRLTHRIADQLVKNLDLLGAGSVRGWLQQWAVIHRSFPGASLLSAFRPGAITSSGNTSYHALGRAIDITPSMAIFDWIASRYGRNTKELIFSPAGSRQIKNGARHYYSGQVRADHWDHVHWAMDRGGVASGPGVFAKYTRAPERVLSPMQTRSFDSLVRVLDRSGGGVVVNRHYHLPNYVGSRDELVAALKDADRYGDLDGLSIARR